jgi:hypothetical protein
MVKYGKIMYWSSFAFTVFHAFIMAAFWVLPWIPVVGLLSVGMVSGAMLKWKIMFGHAAADGLVFIIFLIILSVAPDDGGGIAIMVITMIYLLPSIALSVWLGLKLKNHFAEDEYTQLKEEYRVCCCKL